MTIPAGQTQVVVSVVIVDDEEKEGDETVFVWLNYPTGEATLGDRQGKSVIVDDD